MRLPVCLLPPVIPPLWTGRETEAPGVSGASVAESGWNPDPLTVSPLNYESLGVGPGRPHQPISQTPTDWRRVGPWEALAEH